MVHYGVSTCSSFCYASVDSGTGIDPVSNEPETEKTIEHIRYVYGTFESGEEHAVEVTLDDTFTQERRTYASEEEYYAELDGLMEEDKLTVNASLYRQFIHVLYPAEIRLLDMHGEVVIGDYVHITTTEAGYKYHVNDADSSPVLEEYWGEDGQEVQRELSRFYSLIEAPEELSQQSFKNPFIQSQADDLITAAKSSSQDQHKSLTVANNYRDTHFTGEVGTVCLPSVQASEANVSQYCYGVGFQYWNQSTSTKRRRAIGGTDTRVSFQGVWYDSASQWPPGFGARIRLEVSARGGHSERTATCIGDLAVGSIDYSNNPPYSQTLVQNSCSSISVVANRKPRRGAKSSHRYGFHDYFTPQESADGTIYLVYSYSGNWSGSGELE